MKKLRGAIIGNGFIANKGHLPAYVERQDVEIVAVCDVVKARQDAAKEKIKNLRTYDDYRTLFEKEKGNLDFVDIAAPAAMHAEITHAALDAGLHVLCEKPLTTTLEDAKKVVEHAKSAKRVVFPCHNYKHAPVVKAIRHELDSGRIGKVRSITLSTFRNTHAKGVKEWNTDWRRFHKWSGGGIAMDHGSHSFYLTFDWLGSYPTSITSKLYNLEPEKYDTEDNFSAVLTFPTGLAHLNLTWTAGVRKVIYTLQCERGAITVEDDNMEIAVMKAAAKGAEGYNDVTWEFEKKVISSDWMDSSHVSWFNSLFDLFRKAINSDDYVSQELKESYLCIQAITKAYESSAKNSQELALSNEILSY